MSAKRLDPSEDPPNAFPSDEEVEEVVGNSSEEEEDDDDDEEEDDDDDEEEEEEGEEEEDDDDDVSSKNPTVKKPESEKNQVSESEPGSDEETGSESETERKDPVKNPEPSVVKNQDPEEVKSASTKSTTKKRSSETDASMDAKRVKMVSGELEKKSGGGGEETKKNYFQRVWTEEDEIALLQGIIDYKNETGASPSDDKNVFYELVKKSISFDVSKTQLLEKLRSLKKKFENNLGKVKKNGEDRAFSKPHERKAFDLSKLVWGANGIMALESSAVKSNAKSNKSKKVEPVEQEAFVLPSLNVESVLKKQEVVSIVESVARFGVDGLAAQQGWNRLASEDKKRFEEQWKELQLREFKFFSKKSGFIHQVITKMAEAFRPNP